MKIYLDACCISRLTDDQSQPRIRREAEAIERILAAVRSGVLIWVASEVLADEVSRNPSAERRLEAESLFSLASATVEVDVAITDRARQLVAQG